jgi:glycosyltransferase involved in cell wall biosynthesis
MMWFWWIYSVCVGGIMLAVMIDAHFGLPTIADLTRPEFDRWPEGKHQGNRQGKHPSISVIVPARDEAAGIAACLNSLAAQDYDNLEIIAVNDRSIDRTGEIMEQSAATFPRRIHVVHITELPQAWLGKTHAMWKGASQASGDWLLFTDGDVIFRPDTIRRTLAYADNMHADHLTILPTMLFHSFGERMMMAFFQLAGLVARPWKVPDPKSSAHLGAGAFNLVRRSAYETVGTFESLRLAVVEDLMLGQRIKRGGFASRAAIGRGMVSVHWASGAMGIVRTLGKNFYAILGYRWYLALTLASFVIAFNVGPFFLVWIAPGWTKLGFAIHMASLFYAYWLFRNFNGLSPAYFLLHPVSATLAAYAILRSMAITVARGGVTWRGTLYPLKDLRKG